MNKRQIIIVAVGITIVMGSFFLSGILGEMKEKPKKRPPVEVKKFVKTASVQYSNVNTWVTAYGRVAAARSLDMIAEVSGRMLEGGVKLKEGQTFKKGTLLYRIDNTEAQYNLNAQKSNFLRDVASILPDIKIDFSNNYEVWQAYFEALDIEKNLPELPKYKSSKEKTFLATKNIYSSYYAIKSAEANLRKYYFYAPFDGSIAQVNFQSGSYVNPGSNIARLMHSKNLEIKVDVPLKDIKWIKKGTPVKIYTDNSIDSWRGTIVRVGEIVNQGTQSIDVYVSISEGDAPIYDGSYLQAEIPGSQIEKAMVLPRNAIFNGNEVFVLEDSVLRVKEITIHKLDAENAIFSGLKEGSELVVEPLINAHNNMKAYKLIERIDFDVESEEDVNTSNVK